MNTSSRTMLTKSKNLPTTKNLVLTENKCLGRRGSHGNLNKSKNIALTEKCVGRRSSHGNLNKSKNVALTEKCFRRWGCDGNLNFIWSIQSIEITECRMEGSSMDIIETCNDNEMCHAKICLNRPSLLSYQTKEGWATILLAWLTLPKNVPPFFWKSGEKFIL